MISDVERLKEVNINTKMNNFFTDERTAAVLDSVRGKKAASPILDSIGRCSNMNLSGNASTPAVCWTAIAMWRWVWWMCSQNLKWLHTTSY